jgi:hypothetical protein
MKDPKKTERATNPFDVWINWPALARMFGWKGSIEDFKKAQLSDLPPLRRAVKAGR